MTILDYLRLKFPDGRQEGGENEYTIFCPFLCRKEGHRTSKRHMYINIRTGYWHCWRCQTGNRDFRKFLQLIGDEDRLDSITLAKIESIEKKKGDTILNDNILMAFNSYLPKQLLSIGFHKEILQKFEIGVDKTRRNIIFPIRNNNGLLIALAAKPFEPSEHFKYYMYKKELQDLYPGYSSNHRNHLYGAYKIKKDESISIVEGYKATMWLWQHGYQTVGLMGSSMTRQQQKLLEQLSNFYYLFLDNDEAGERGTSNTIKTLGRSVRLKRIKGYKHQPDNYTREELKKLIN